MVFTPTNLAALVIASSFAAGLNLYLTILTLGLLSRLQWIALPPGLDSLGDTWVLVVCGLLFAVEFFADKVPAFDVAWNLLHTFIRVPVAALIAFHATAQLSPQMQILAAAAGAIIALAAHTSKTTVRAAITASPEPFSNIALSTAEDTAVVGVTWFAGHHPLAAAGLALSLLLAIIVAAFAMFHLIRGPVRRFLSRRHSVAAQAVQD